MVLAWIVCCVTAFLNVLNQLLLREVEAFPQQRGGVMDRAHTFLQLWELVHKVLVVLQLKRLCREVECARSCHGAAGYWLGLLGGALYNMITCTSPLMENNSMIFWGKFSNTLFWDLLRTINFPFSLPSFKIKAETWEMFPTGVIKNSKGSQVSVGKSSKEGGSHHISKSSQVWKIMHYFPSDEDPRVSVDGHKVGQDSGKKYFGPPRIII